MDLIIYKNEAELLKDNIKRKFKERYKHFNLRIYFHIENELLQGIDIEVEEPLLHLIKQKYFSLDGFYDVSSLVDYTMITINELVLTIIHNYYGVKI